MDPQMKRIGILVLGMHRSGTSAVTRVLNLLGADLPGNLLPGVVGDNAPGYWESRDVVAVNDAILESAGLTWSDWNPLTPHWPATPTADRFKQRLVELLDTHFAQSPLFVIKDPRLCRFPWIWADALARVGARPCAIIPYRHPAEVERSLRKRLMPGPQAKLLWLRYVLDAELGSRGMPRVFFSYDELLYDWRATAARIGRELSIAWPRWSARAEVEIDDFVTVDHRSHHGSYESLAGMSPRSLGEVFLAMKALSNHEDTALLFQRLDRIRTQFDAGCELVGPAAWAYEKRFVEAYASFLRTQEHAETLARQTERLEERLAAEVAQSQARLDESHRLTQALDAASRTILELETLVTAFEHSTSWRITAPLRALKMAGMKPSPDRQPLPHRHPPETAIPAEPTVSNIIMDPSIEDPAQVPSEMAAPATAECDEWMRDSLSVPLVEPSLDDQGSSAPATRPSPDTVHERSDVQDEPAHLVEVDIHDATHPAPEPEGATTTHDLAPLVSGDMPPDTRATSPSGQRVVLVTEQPATPGAVYRLDHLSAALGRCGYRVSHIDASGTTIDPTLLDDCQTLILWGVHPRAEITELIEHARSARIRVLHDTDDLKFDPSLVPRGKIDGLRSLRKDADEAMDYFRRFRTMLESSDLCSASTVPLAREIERLVDRPAYFMPNGFTKAIFDRARMAARARAFLLSDGLTRIGYATGSLTHQQDFAVCADAVARVLLEHPGCRLVLFFDEVADGSRLPFLNVSEFPALARVRGQIEWRRAVPLAELYQELARFDINIVPLEAENIFCECKSELKLFEAALAGVCTLASPSEPFRRAIRHGETGFLAASEDDWYETLSRLITESTTRQRVAEAAVRAVLWPHGPLRRAYRSRALLSWLDRDTESAIHCKWALDDQYARVPPPPRIAGSEVRHSIHRLIPARISIIVALERDAPDPSSRLNALEACRLEGCEIIVVDNRADRAGHHALVDWLAEHQGRFVRLLAVGTDEPLALGALIDIGIGHASTLAAFVIHGPASIDPEAIQASYDRLEAAPCAAVILEPPQQDASSGDHNTPLGRPMMLSVEAWARVGGHGLDQPERRAEEHILWRFRKEGLDVVTLSRPTGQALTSVNPTAAGSVSGDIERARSTTPSSA